MTGGHVKLESLTKRFGDVTAVDEISVEIEAGEFFCLPGMVERLVFLGSTTHIYVRLATGSGLQALVRNEGTTVPYNQGTPVMVNLPADALRVLPDPGVSVAEIRDETLGDEPLNLTSAALASSISA